MRINREVSVLIDEDDPLLHSMEPDNDLWEKLNEESLSRGLPTPYCKALQPLLDLSSQDCLLDLWAHDLNALEAADHAQGGSCSYVGVDIQFAIREPLYPLEGDAVLHGIESERDFIVLEGYETRFCYRVDNPFDPSTDFTSLLGNSRVKVFCRPPFGGTVSDLCESYPNAPAVLRRAFGEERSVAEWYYAAAALSYIGDDGKACVLMPDRALMGDKSTGVRKSIVEAGLLESVVMLPNFGWEDGNGPGYSLVTLSRENVKATLVNLRSYSGDTRFDEFGEEVSRLVSMEGDRSITVSKDQMARLNYTFDARAHLDSGPFGGDLPTVTLVDVKRGIPQRVVDELRKPLTITDEDGFPNEVVVAQYSEFRSGEIVDYDKLANRAGSCMVSSEEMNAKRFHVVRGPRLVFSRMGPQFKVALFEGVIGPFHPWDYDDTQNDSSGLILLETLMSAAIPDGVEPVYLLAFFRSERGQALLKNAAAKGLQLSTKNLQSIAIPIPDSEAQKAIAEQYLKLLEEEEEYIQKLDSVEKGFLGYFRQRAE